MIYTCSCLAGRILSVFTRVCFYYQPNHTYGVRLSVGWPHHLDVSGYYATIKLTHLCSYMCIASAGIGQALPVLQEQSCVHITRQRAPDHEKIGWCKRALGPIKQCTLYRCSSCFSFAVVSPYKQCTIVVDIID